jgi:hypothetical protein
MFGVAWHADGSLGTQGHATKQCNLTMQVMHMHAWQHEHGGSALRRAIVVVAHPCHKVGTHISRGEGKRVPVWARPQCVRDLSQPRRGSSLIVHHQHRRYIMFICNAQPPISGLLLAAMDLQRTSQSRVHVASWHSGVLGHVVTSSCAQTLVVQIQGLATKGGQLVRRQQTSCYSFDVARRLACGKKSQQPCHKVIEHQGLHTCVWQYASN